MPTAPKPKTVTARNRGRTVGDLLDGRMAAPGQEVTVPADHPAIGDWLVIVRKPSTSRSAGAPKES